ncbi:solute carrier family 22 member 1-like [Oncorhynchus kisutch]|uniref:solute carrier family 22 member 1-like n=1 Tax=Oncorhynchus kisutch TaxID=8019 RepID=UPI0009A096E1|nr:solute carrier family 22 member 1-like [Oncorhynchus kisutch]
MDTRKITVPVVNTSGVLVHSQCEQYELDWNATGLTCDNPESDLTDALRSKAPMTSCKEGWEYDYKGRQSFVTEFDLVCNDAWVKYQATFSFLMFNLLNGVA